MGDYVWDGLELVELGTYFLSEEVLLDVCRKYGHRNGLNYKLEYWRILKERYHMTKEFIRDLIHKKDIKLAQKIASVYEHYPIQDEYDVDKVELGEDCNLERFAFQLKEGFLYRELMGIIERYE